MMSRASERVAALFVAPSGSADSRSKVRAMATAALRSALLVERLRSRTRPSARNVGIHAYQIPPLRKSSAIREPAFFAKKPSRRDGT
jgi:hypothetical protein